MNLTEMLLFVTFGFTLFITLKPDDIRGSSKNTQLWKDVFKDALKMGKRQTSKDVKCYNGRGYYVVSDTKEFELAKQICNDNGHTLVHVIDKKHNKWLTKTFGTDSMWIGLRDTYLGNRVFKWNNKEPLTYKNFLQNLWRYLRSTTIAAMIVVNGKWTLLNEKSLYNCCAFICESNSSRCKKNIRRERTCKKYDNRAHYFVKLKKGLDDAKQYCSKEFSGTLVWIRDKSHNDWLGGIANKFLPRGTAFIGLEDIKHREFTWTDGQKLTFSMLNKSSDGYEVPHNCVYMNNGYWHTGHCDNSRKPFICEGSSTSCKITAVDGNWGNWTKWSSCSKTCGGGNQNRSRSCDNPKPQYGGSNCTGNSTQSQSCNEHPCPIDGNWGNWTVWSNCSKPCDGGNQNRSRSCDNPKPQYGGSNCTGNSTQSQSCNEHPCPKTKCLLFKNIGHYFLKLKKNFTSAKEFCESYGLSLLHVYNREHNEWLNSTFGNDSMWIALRDTYKGRRIFKWNNREPLNYTNWADGQPSTERLLDMVTMNISDGQWSSTNSKLNDCCYFICESNSSNCILKSVNDKWTCVVYDNRAHYFVKLKKHLNDAKQYCSTKFGGILVWIRNEKHNNWLQNTAFDMKNVIIGLEDIKHREFTWTDGQNLTFSAFKDYGSGYSNNFDCVITKNAGEWQEIDCDSLEYFTCHSSSGCGKVDGVWGKWTNWTDCSRTCDDGIRQRWRLCDNPAPKYDGKMCEGESNQTEPCKEKDCPINGNWGDWSDWSICSQSCGGGSQKRSRLCNDPVPQYGGDDCKGDREKSRKCNEKLKCQSKMRLEYTTYQKIHNNDLFFNGDVVQCSSSHHHVMFETWITFSCSGSADKHTETCSSGVCQLILKFSNPQAKSCTLLCNGTITDEYTDKFNVSFDQLSIIPDERIILRLEEVEPAEGNLRESDYDIKCFPNRFAPIKSLYFMEDCTDSRQERKKHYCDKRDNCKMSISVESSVHCNISCQADLHDKKLLNKLEIDWKTVCIMPQWNEWSPCSQSCGVGWQTRERRCTVVFEDKEEDEDEDDDLPCYEADSRRCDTKIKCEFPDDDPSFYFPPRDHPESTIQYMWDITPSGDPND